MHLREREPLVTLRSFPRLFAVGIPGALLVGLLVGVVMLPRGLEGALVAMVSVQTLGFLVLYVIAQRRRMDPLRRKEPQP